MVFWFAVTFGGKHAYWMNVRKMLSGICIIDRTEMCKILNTYALNGNIYFGPSQRNASRRKCLIQQKKSNGTHVTMMWPLLRRWKAPNGDYRWITPQPGVFERNFISESWDSGTKETFLFLLLGRKWISEWKTICGFKESELTAKYLN